MRNQTPPEKVTVRIAIMADMLDICRSTAYELVKSGEVPSIRIGKSIRIPVEAIHAIARRATAEGERIDA